MTITLSNGEAHAHSNGNGNGNGNGQEGLTSTRAWVTLITNPAYLAGVLTLHRTIESLSVYPLIVMVTPSLPSSSVQILQNQSRGSNPSLRIIKVEQLQPKQHSGFGEGFSRFGDTWTKLRSFGLEGYERVCMIDSDMILLRSMDELFDLELPGDDWIGAVPACVCNPLKIPHYPKDWIPANCQFSAQTHPTTYTIPPTLDNTPNAPRTASLLNSGLVLLQPSQGLMSTIIHHLNTSPDIATLAFPDQEVIAAVFKGRWKVLPWWTNALKTLRAVHQDLWRDEEVRLIHYILDKPWYRRPAHLQPYQSPINSTLTLPPTPISAQIKPTNGHSRRPLPVGLLDAVHNSAPQKSVRIYDEVDAWWWIVYEDVLRDLQEQGETSGWREVDAGVRR